MNNAAWCLIVLVVGGVCHRAHGQFATIINAPPTVIGNNQAIGSNTQLNVLHGGSVGSSFDAGALNGSSINVEVNISGGVVGPFFEANNRSTVRISGGLVGNDFTANSGSDVIISGGVVGNGFHANGGTDVSISGGQFDDGFTINTGGFMSLFGSEFRLNGALISGLDTQGNFLPFNLPAGAVLEGRFASGKPFAFSSLDSDSIANGALLLHADAITGFYQTLIIAPPDPVPTGIGNGQTLFVSAGGVVGENFNAGWGSTVQMSGGQVGSNFEAAGAQVTIAGGTVGSRFDAFHGSVISISGGGVGELFDAHSGSEVNILGGSVGSDFNANSGSIVNISSGSVGNSFDALSGSVVKLSGGTVGIDFDASNGSTVLLVGTQFVLNNVDITTSLSPSSPLTITDRNVVLSGLLADGSPFSFDLNSIDGANADFFSSSATLTVTLSVPGDFDGDADADGADFLAWQRGQSPYPVSSADLALWRTNYGNTLASAVAGAVPEPGSVSLLACGAVLLVVARRWMMRGIW